MPWWWLRSYIPTEEELFEDFGSFTYLPTDSYDGRYRAELNIERREGDLATTVYVFITDTEGDEIAQVIRSERAYDFWGICWEYDNYNLWIQSSDIGTVCYSFNGEEWEKNNEAVKPDYIVTRH